MSDTPGKKPAKLETGKAGRGGGEGGKGEAGRGGRGEGDRRQGVVEGGREGAIMRIITTLDICRAFCAF